MSLLAAETVHPFQRVLAFLILVFVAAFMATRVHPFSYPQARAVPRISMFRALVQRCSGQALHATGRTANQVPATAALSSYARSGTHLRQAANGGME